MAPPTGYNNKYGSVRRDRGATRHVYVLRNTSTVEMSIEQHCKIHTGLKKMIDNDDVFCVSYTTFLGRGEGWQLKKNNLFVTELMRRPVVPGDVECGPSVCCRQREDRGGDRDLHLCPASLLLAPRPSR